jgi:hypothetical protein
VRVGVALVVGDGVAAGVGLFGELRPQAAASRPRKESAPLRKKPRRLRRI